MLARQLALGLVVALPAAAQVYDYPGPSPNITGPGLNFDAPGIVPGPVTPSLFVGSGFTSIVPVGPGWGSSGTSTYFGGWGQVLASVGAVPTIVDGLTEIDRATWGDGWEITLSAPVDELQLRFSDPSFFNHDVELFLGSTSLGVGRFGTPSQAQVRYFRAEHGPFDRALITIHGTSAVGFESLALGTGPPPPAPPGDECATAVVVGQGLHPYTTRSGSESPEPWTCAGAGSADVWFQYEAVTNGFDLQVCLDHTDYYPRCEIYEGTCGALTLVTCGTAQCGLFGITMPGIVAGTRYMIRIGGSNGARGAGRLRINERIPSTPAPPGCVQSYFAADSATADGGALFFDLDVANPIDIAGLELNTSSTGPVGLEVFAIAGSYAASAANAGGAGWTRVATDDGQAVGQGLDAPTPVNFAAPWALPAGTWGVAVIGRNMQSGATLPHAYSAGTLFNQEFVSPGAVVRLTAGAAADVPWSANLVRSSVWNGRLCFVRQTLGDRYCTANPNATGAPASLWATGSLAVAQNDLTLRGEQLPANVFGFFLTSRTQGFVPNPSGSLGNLCLGGSIGRFVGPGQIQSSGPAGSISLLLDLARLPTPTGLVPAGVGEAWNFTLWFRDSGGVATSNFTDGVEVVFE